MVTSLAQALAHDGFDLTRHAWSQLAAGPQGWIQMANLVLTGAMVVAFAVGLRRSSSSRWAPRLVATYGAGLIAAGLLVADPAAGYPVGAPVPTVPSWHGIGHFVAGGIGFAAFIAACFVLARTFSRSGARRLAWWSRHHRHRFHRGIRRDQQRLVQPGRHPGLRGCGARRLGLARRGRGAPVPVRDRSPQSS